MNTKILTVTHLAKRALEGAHGAADFERREDGLWDVLLPEGLVDSLESAAERNGCSPSDIILRVFKISYAKA